MLGYCCCQVAHNDFWQIYSMLWNLDTTRCQIWCTIELHRDPISKVVKMVLNTQCYQYLWLTMWFHAKKIKRNTQKTKIADFTMKWVKMENRWQKFYPPADSDRRDKSHLWWLYWNWSFFLFFSAEIMVIFLESDVMFGFLDIRSPCTLQDRPERW